MSITTLYAELVVVGTGALVFVLLFFYALFGNQSWLDKLQSLPDSIGNAIYLIPGLSVIYLLGIVISNVSHLLFERRENRLRKEKLNEFEYDEIRNGLYTSPDAKELVGDFEFRRSKVRICRGWFLNCIFIIAALAACWFLEKMSWPVTAFWIITVVALMVGTYKSWQTATCTELEWLKSYAKQLRADRRNTKVISVEGLRTPLERG